MKVMGAMVQRRTIFWPGHGCWSLAFKAGAFDGLRRELTTCRLRQIFQIAAVSVVATWLAPSTLAQETVISTIVGDGGWATFGGSASEYVLASAWQQSTSYSNVDVALELNTGTSLIAVDFYLTTKSGPGTTTANEVARSSVSISARANVRQLVPVFTGLTLGPGTYYLTGAPRNGGGGWEISSTGAAAVTATGVSLVDGMLGSHNSFDIAAYPPASLWDQGAYGANFEYIVSAPEPSPLVLFGAACLGVLAKAQRSARHSCHS